jgi:hypothetical protein
MNNNIIIKEYQKPELINIDDHAFDENGQGGSLICPGNPSCTCNIVVSCPSGICINGNCRNGTCSGFTNGKG